jgi:hypothetical protein
VGADVDDEHEEMTLFFGETNLLPTVQNQSMHLSTRMLEEFHDLSRNRLHFILPMHGEAKESKELNSPTNYKNQDQRAHPK